MVTSASASGSPLGLKPSPSRSFINASISTGRNCAEAGMVKTRGEEAMAAALCHRPLVRAIGNRLWPAKICADVDKARVRFYVVEVFAKRAHFTSLIGRGRLAKRGG